MTPQPAPGPTILVIEDEMIVAMYMEDVLTDLGCRVATAARVENGLDIIRTQHIHGAFLDVSVAGAPVTPVVSELSARGIPFAFVTGYEAHQLPADYRSRPILSKPVIETKIAEVLAGFAVYQQAAAEPAT
ncbi:MAG: response regulator [Rhodospirillaceae bacterium]